ncbi:MAG: hypothetical protein ACE5EL_07430, partial [Anaerolineae bacterium]
MMSPRVPVAAAAGFAALALAVAATVAIPPADDPGRAPKGSAPEGFRFETLARVGGPSRPLAFLVIGDLMLDKYIWGDVERISPEAPVPVVKVVG